MPVIKKAKPYKRWLVYALSFFLFLFIGSLVAAEFFVVPVLKKRLHTLIVQGSDSLYSYTLGDLNASILGGNVEIKDLQINVDSLRYKQLKENNELPPLTMQLNMIKGEIKGIAVFKLLFSKKISINEITTKDANIRLSRHLIRTEAGTRKKQPLWKSIQPAIKSIEIKTINLDGVKLLYRNADTATSIKLQFDTCNALFNNVLIDSIASADTTRIGFSKEVSFRFNDLKFRTSDSVSKMKAEVITYSSKSRIIEIINFKVQPTREEKKEFYAYVKGQQEMYVMEFEKAALSNFRLDQFINRNVIAADSFIVQKPRMDIYLDKTAPALFKNKIGSYPHQKLLLADIKIRIKYIAIHNANVSYTEKAAMSKQEGTLTLSSINLSATNVTNDSADIISNNKCVAIVNGAILGKSPINARFTFYLDSANGRFDALGTITNVNAAQLNELAVPFANVQLQSFNLHRLDFELSGNDFNARGKVGMRYDDLFLTIRKTNAETGVTTTNKFLTKLVNKYTLQSSNPAPGQSERSANVVYLRTSSKGYFGLIWKTIFTGMQSIMLSQGQLE